MITKGTLFILTSGEYSSFEVHTVCKATVDIDAAALKVEYLSTRPEQASYGFEERAFIAWLLNEKKAAEELDYTEWFLGGYGEGNFSIS